MLELKIITARSPKDVEKEFAKFQKENPTQHIITIYPIVITPINNYTYDYTLTIVHENMTSKTV